MPTEIPVFHTERLILRPVCLADAESYEKNFVDYDVISELASTVPWPYPSHTESEVWELTKDVWLRQRNSF